MNMWMLAIFPIESTNTTSMEDVSTRVLEKTKEYIRSKDKAKNDMMYQDIYKCICQNKKSEDILSSMSSLQPNWCLKIDFQKVDQHAGGKWLIHDTKRRKNNQMKSLKPPCRISKLSMIFLSQYLNKRWHKLLTYMFVNGIRNSGNHCRTWP